LLNSLYGAMWSDQFIDEVVTFTIKKLWLHYLKDYSPSLIHEAIIETGKTFKLPPKPADLLVILKMLKKREEDRLEFERKLGKAPRSHLTPIPRYTLEILEAKKAMWLKLRRHDKVRILEDEIASLAMQKVGDRMPP
jgi:hypothetical protein